jgi:hypothetical protein
LQVTMSSLSNSNNATTLRAVAPLLLQRCKWLCCHCCDLGPSDVYLIFVGLLLDDLFKFRPSNFHPSKDFRLMFVELSSCALRPAVLLSCTLSSYALSSYVLPFRRLVFSSDICLNSVHVSSNLRWMFVWPSHDVCLVQVIPNNALYFSNRTLCF